MLPFPRRQYACANLFRAFGRYAAAKLFVLHRGHFNVNIDPVQQRTADF